mgnify:CR=1 FL=1
MRIKVNRLSADYVVVRRQENNRILMLKDTMLQLTDTALFDMILNSEFISWAYNTERFPVLTKEILDMVRHEVNRLKSRDLNWYKKMGLPSDVIPAIEQVEDALNTNDGEKVRNALKVLSKSVYHLVGTMLEKLENIVLEL